MPEKVDFLSKSNIKKILLICFLVILMFVAIYNIRAIFGVVLYFIDLIFPFIIGACIAFIFNVPLRKIETGLFKKKPDFKGKRAISYILSLLLVIGILTLALFVILPELIETVKQITTQIPNAIERSKDFLLGLTHKFPEINRAVENIEIDYQGIINKLVSFFTDATGVLSQTLDFVTGVVSGFATFLIGFAFSIYVLFRKEELARQFKKVIYAFIPEKQADKFLDICDLSNKTFSNFITGQCLEACILGLMFFVVLSIMRMPYTLLISVLIALTALIPIFGAFIGCGIGALLILFIDPKQALIFIITFLILQQIEGNLIYPHVVGGSVGLPSIWVLVAITIGGDLMGVAGMLIFIPLCSVVYALFKEFVNARLKKKGIPPEMYEKSHQSKIAVAQEAENKAQPKNKTKKV